MKTAKPRKIPAKRRRVLSESPIGRRNAALVALVREKLSLTEISLLLVRDVVPKDPATMTVRLVTYWTLLVKDGEMFKMLMRGLEAPRYATVADLLDALVKRVEEDGPWPGQVREIVRTQETTTAQLVKGSLKMAVRLPETKRFLKVTNLERVIALRRYVELDAPKSPTAPLFPGRSQHTGLTVRGIRLLLSKLRGRRSPLAAIVLP